MARIYLVEGPVGAGKSTFAAQLAGRHRAPRLILDDWMATLFRPDRPETEVIPWYLERKDRCLEQIWKLTVELMEASTSVVLELGLIQRAGRAQFLERLDQGGYPYTLYVLEASREVRRERVRRRNLEQGSTFSMVVPDAVFERASDLWEELEDNECEGRDVQFVRTDVQPQGASGGS